MESQAVQSLQASSCSYANCCYDPPTRASLETPPYVSVGQPRGINESHGGIIDREVTYRPNRLQTGDRCRFQGSHQRTWSAIIVQRKTLLHRYVSIHRQRYVTSTHFANLEEEFDICDAFLHIQAFLEYPIRHPTGNGSA